MKVRAAPCVLCAPPLQRRRAHAARLAWHRAARRQRSSSRLLLRAAAGKLCERDGSFRLMLMYGSLSLTFLLPTLLFSIISAIFEFCQALPRVYEAASPHSLAQGIVLPRLRSRSRSRLWLCPLRLLRLFCWRHTACGRRSCLLCCLSLRL